jgi:hypothetical protein
MEELTSAERQLIAILRQDFANRANQLVIEWRNGAWEITLKELDTKRGSRGTGATFDDAWRGMDRGYTIDRRV